jgi:Zn-dependent protease with chaperone function
MAVGLMFGFYLLALGICAALGMSLWFDATHGRVHPKLWLFSGGAILAIGTAIWPRRLTFDDPGVPLTEANQPELWKLVREVASDAGQAPPAQLFLAEDVNAFVTERDSRLGFGGKRVLGIGLPLMHVLTVPQLRAVLAHEFGHFYGGDTKLGPFLYRTRMAIGRTITKLKKKESKLSKPFEWYGKWFLRVTHSISREQEYAADAVAVRLTGREPAASALRRIGGVAALFDHYLEDEMFPALNAGARPGLLDGFAGFLAAPEMQEPQQRMAESAMQAKSDPYDTHPRLHERLAAIAEVTEPGSMPAEGPLSTTLLRDLPQLETAVLVYMTGRPDIAQIPATDWSAACAAAAVRPWREFAAEHGAKFAGLTIADYASQSGALGELATRVDAEIPADRRDGAGAWMLTAMLNQALLRAGFVVESSPGRPIALVRGEERFEPRRLGGELREGKLVEADWRARCERLGVADLPLVEPSTAKPGE